MHLTRRRFLASATSLASAACLPCSAAAGEPAGDAADLPRVDLHVHLDNSTIDQVVQLSHRQGVRYGIVEHAGTKENIYPVVLSNNDELMGYLDMLQGYSVYRGVQTEWTDWMGCFSSEALARLDFVLTDAMTFPGDDGRRVKLWEDDAPARVDMSDKPSFMDRYVDWHLAILEEQPVDILANVSWLPAPLAPDYDSLWTPARVRRVVEAAVRHGVALEIGARRKLPKRFFLELARECGARFSFGTNGRYPDMGQIDYSLQAARQLGLTRADVFLPNRRATRVSQARR